MKFLATLLTLSSLVIGSHAFAYDLNCKMPNSPNSNITMHLAADGSDGSLDFLTINVFGTQYGESSIATPWTQWKTAYQVDDNVVKADFPMRDGSTIQFALKHEKNVYRGNFTVTAANQSPVTVPMICID